MSNLETMYNGQAFTPTSRLADSIGESDSIIKVNNVSVFPPAPNLITIDDGDGTGETILYTALTSDSLSGCKRGIEGTAKQHLKGAVIGRFFTAYDLNSVIKNILELNNNKVEQNQQATSSVLGLVKADSKTSSDNIPAKIGSDGKLYISSSAVINTIPNADTMQFGGI